MRSNRTDRLGRSFQIIMIISLILIVLMLPGAATRGFIGTLTVCFYIFLASLAVQGSLVLWSGRSKVKNWSGQLLRWAVLVTLILSAALTLSFIVTGNPVASVGFEIRSIERFIGVPSIEGGISLFMILWVFLMALTWFFVAALSGGIWLMAKAIEKFLPDLLIDLKKLTFDRRDPWPRRIAAWLLSFPKVLEPASLTLEIQSLDDRMSRQRLSRAVAWQMTLGTILAIYISLNPALLSVLPFTQTYALVSIPVGLIPLLILPLLTLEALGVKAPGPRSNFYLYGGGKNRMLQVSLALGGLFWIIWWSASKVGLGRIAATFGIYVVLLLLFSVLVSFIYFQFFETPLIDHIVAQLEERGF